MKKKVILTSIIFIISSILGIILDYTNFLHIISKNFNYNFLGIYFNGLILLFIFIMTYILVDSSKVQKEEKETNNQRQAIKILLKITYSNCQATLKMLSDTDFVEKYVVPKADFYSLKDEFIERQKELPFEYHEIIMEFMKKGNIDYSLFESYLEIKSLFGSYLNMRITFFDIDKYRGKNRKIDELNVLLTNDKNKLDKILADQLVILNTREVK